MATTPRRSVRLRDPIWQHAQDAAREDADPSGASGLIRRLLERDKTEREAKRNQGADNGEDTGPDDGLDARTTPAGAHVAA